MRTKLALGHSRRPPSLSIGLLELQLLATKFRSAGQPLPVLTPTTKAIDFIRQAIFSGLGACCKFSQGVLLPDHNELHRPAWSLDLGPTKGTPLSLSCPKARC